jgi:hypothetical protein
MTENQLEIPGEHDGTDIRLAALKQWVKAQLGVNTIIIKPASGDASFRRYFRVWVGDTTYIAMDAPPEKENCAAFVDIAFRLQLNSIHAPAVHAKDLQQGFLLLDDLGNKLYLSGLDAKSAGPLYRDALDTLLCMQSNVPADDLPPYDHRQLQNEMDLFVDWFLSRHLHIKLNGEANDILTDCFELLIASALEQPKVFVHRDYHSRNLMICDTHNPGVLDFQDAMYGPITYDLVSLLRDCYIAWPKNQVQQWLKFYHLQLTEQQLISVDLVKFERWFDWMGMQRHLKAIGIFARLNHRDGKPNYLSDIPRTYDYILAVCKYYPDFMAFSELMARLQIHERLTL